MIPLPSTGSPLDTSVGSETFKSTFQTSGFTDRVSADVENYSS